MTLKSQLASINKLVDDIKPIKILGKVTAVKGTIIECVGINEFVSVGSRCKVRNTFKRSENICEVVGFDHNVVLLMPFEDTEGISADSEVEVFQHDNTISPDLMWLGRIIDAFGMPIDNKGPIKNGEQAYPLKGVPIASQKRNKVGHKIDLGVKAIDTFVSCCFGQRMGIFAGSGVGKSVLISMLTKYADVDVKVIGLVGERSREVKEFIDDYLGPEGLKQAVVVVATGDESPLMRKRAAYTTMTIAEFFRDQGKEVLCIIDSVTRFAMAQREIGLAIGEPATTKGYTPSVFSELPKLFERSGPGIGQNSITGLFSVLVEGDDQNEPISDAVRGILDGHIVLDRAIAERGRFPAVDILKSISRTVPKCNSDLENKQIKYAKKMLSIYNDMAEMIRLGAYKKGTDPEVDEAIGYYKKLEDFLSQKPDEAHHMADSYQKLGAILGITE